MIHHGRARIPHPVQRRPNTRADNALPTGFDISSTAPANSSGSVFCQSLTRTYLRGGQLAYGSPRARAWLPASVRDLPGASTTGVALPGGARAGCPPPPQAECRRVSGGARARLATPPRLRDLVVVDEHAPVAVRYTHSRFTDTGFPTWTLRPHSRCIGGRPPGWLPSNHGLAAENRGRHGRQSLPLAVAWFSPANCRLSDLADGHQFSLLSAGPRFAISGRLWPALCSSRYLTDIYPPRGNKPHTTIQNSGGQ